MSSNENLIKKADIALADLSSNGGLLLPEQNQQFIRVLMESPTIFNSIRMVTMNSPQRKINKIGFGSRILHAAGDASTDINGNGSRALSASQRAKPDLSQVTLSTKEVIAEIHIPYEVFEDNIEGGNINVAMGKTPGGLQDTIVTMIAERAALDFEELCIDGDSTSSDSFLALHDGFLKQANSHIVDANGKTVSKDLFKAGVNAMPPKYLRNRSALKHFISIDNENEYRDTLANRQTALGDASVQGNNSVYSFGSEVVGVPLMPGDRGLFTNPLNLIFGIQRQITIEYDKDIRSRMFIIVLTARMALAIEQDDAVVTYRNILGS
jgi:hypothetical protein